jgi:hypothetical protein
MGPGEARDRAVAPARECRYVDADVSDRGLPRYETEVTNDEPTDAIMPAKALTPHHRVTESAAPHSFRAWPPGFWRYHHVDRRSKAHIEGLHHGSLALSPIPRATLKISSHLGELVKSVLTTQFA